MNLNERQLEAVQTIDGAVMVMAGAGSGKTSVLTNRIVNLINNGVSPYKILAVTFTNKAANEMKERIEQMIDNQNISVKNMWIHTFHAFCAKFLRREWNSDFAILDTEDAEKIVKNIMNELNIDTKDYKPGLIYGVISKRKNDSTFAIDDMRIKNIYSKVEPKYQEYLYKNNVLDFDELILKTIDVLKTNEYIRNKYRSLFDYILIDEFQDTNLPQYELMCLLTNEKQNVFVVGDDFQSIYGFRGAKIGNITRFRNDFINHKLILLEQNYRSTAPILNLANDVITRNRGQIKKTMFTDQKGGDMPSFTYHQNDEDELESIIENIKANKNEDNTYGDFAILYRSNYLSRLIEEKLAANNIPYVLYGGLSYFSRKEVKDMLAYMRLLVNRNDDLSFERIINEPKRKIGPSIINKLKDIAFINACSLWESINYMEASNSVGYKALIDFKKMINEISDAVDNMKLIELVDVLLMRTGYREMLKTDEKEQDRLENIMELKSVIRNQLLDSPDKTNRENLTIMLQELALRTDADNKDNKNAVIVSTYHQVKGLEFDYVYMYAMNESIFPSNRAIEEGNIEEERRICYVGITRAKKGLMMSASEERYVFGRHNYYSVSPFVNEMDSDLYEETTPKKSETVITKEEADCKHDYYGYGKIIKEETLYNIEFVEIQFSKDLTIKMMKNDSELVILK